MLSCNLSVKTLRTTISSLVLTEVTHAWIFCKHNENIKVSKQVVWNHFDICKKNGEAFYLIVGTCTEKAYNSLNTFTISEIKNFTI